ncbi:MAG: hypothetical protein CMF45_02925 [Legionellales bacterium]|nr:hypothetical protein [Legionellales bacterium]
MHPKINAQYNLGLAYIHFKPQDYKQAIYWLSKSADQGNMVAQHQMGIMYREGYGVLKDYVMAYMFFNIASANGHG